MENKITVLLTACINPNGMCLTKLQDPETRLKHYLRALEYYLLNTRFKVVVVENTLFDFAKVIDLKWIVNGRLEVLFFDGNNYDKTKGKGLGEALIIDYAFKNSRFLVDSDYVLKITGRYIITNLEKNLKYVEEYILQKKEIVIVEEMYYRYKSASSECLFASKLFYLNYFLSKIDQIDDSASFFFEHLLYKSINQWRKDYYFFVFRTSLDFDAISGTTSAVIRKDFKVRLLHIMRRYFYNTIYFFTKK